MIYFFDLEFDLIDTFPDVKTASHPINNIIFIEYNEQLVSGQVHVISKTASDEKYNLIEVSESLGVKITSIKEYVCETEKDMILNFLDFTTKIEVLHGYNVNSFDFDYILKRASNLGINENQFKKFTTVDLMVDVANLNEESCSLQRFMKKHYSVNYYKCGNNLKHLTCCLFTIKVWKHFNDLKVNILKNYDNADYNAGYHLTKIEKGVLGYFSKIKEEFLEAEDAIAQNNSVMALVELSDLLGAIEAYANTFNMSLDDLLTMKDATKRAFESGRRS